MILGNSRIVIESSLRASREPGLAIFERRAWSTTHLLREIPILSTRYLAEWKFIIDDPSKVSVYGFSSDNCILDQEPDDVLQ